MKPSRVSSRYFVSFAHHQSYILEENTQVRFKSSKILEDWVDLYLDELYIGTIPESEFKQNFKTDPLVLATDII